MKWYRRPPTPTLLGQAALQARAVGAMARATSARRADFHDSGDRVDPRRRKQRWRRPPFDQLNQVVVCAPSATRSSSFWSRLHVLAAVGGWRYARASAPVNGPIILISIDALRADRLPVYGYAESRRRPSMRSPPTASSSSARTPTRRRRCRRMRRCCPAGCRSRPASATDVGFVVKARERLLAEMLRDRGYATGAVVSSFVLRRETGIDQGFAFFDARHAAPPRSAIGGLCRATATTSERIAEQWLDGVGTSRAVPVPASGRAAHARTADRTVLPSTSPYDARDRVRRRDRRPADPVPEGASALRSVDDHPRLRSRRRARRSRRAGARTVRLRRGAARAAHHQAGRRRRRRPPRRAIWCSTWISCRRFSISRRPRSRQPAGAIAQAAARRYQTLPRRLIYSESLYGRYQFGWSESDAHRRPVPVHQGATRRALRPGDAIRASAMTLRPPARTWASGSARCAR